MVGLQPLEAWTPVQLLYNNFAVVLGLVYVHLPFMVLPLYSALDRLDKSLIEASLDLGAGHFKTLTRIVMPLAAPGIAAGVMITLIPALGAYLTPDLMGGTDSQMIANVIERQFKRANDWPFGAALSFMLIYAMFIIVALQSLRGDRKKGDALMALFKRTPIAPLEYTRTLWMRTWVGATLLFLYAPLIVLMIFSFNDSKRNVVWKGFTFKYYEKALNNSSLVEALVNSLTIALLATVISVVMGALAGVMLWRFRFPVQGRGRGDHVAADHRPGDLPGRRHADLLRRD